MRWRCRNRNEVIGVANIQVPLPEIKAFPFNSTNKKLLPLQPEKSLKTSVSFTLSSVSFFYFFFLSSFFSFLSQHTELSQVQNSSPTLSLSFLSSHPLLLWLSPFWQSFLLESKEKPPFSSPLLAFISDPFVPPASIHFPMHSALENSPSTSKPHSPITLLTNSPCKLTPLSFQLASPPRIHMDSWWATRNPNQGPKWTYNIAQDRSGAYGPKPCRN